MVRVGLPGDGDWNLQRAALAGLVLFVPGMFFGGQSKGNEEETLTRLSWDEVCCSRGCSPLLAVLPALAGRAEASPQAEACVILLAQVTAVAHCAFD